MITMIYQFKRIFLLFGIYENWDSYNVGRIDHQENYVKLVQKQQENPIH